MKTAMSPLWHRLVLGAALTMTLSGCLKLFDLDGVYWLDSKNNGVGSTGGAGGSGTTGGNGGIGGGIGASSNSSASVSNGAGGAAGVGGAGGAIGTGGDGGNGGSAGSGGSGGALSICGDTVVSGFEGCDDGAMVDGDGCSRTCSKEYSEMATINDTFMDADTIGIVATNDTIIAGSLNPATDVDTFQWKLTADSVVRFESFEGTAIGDCLTAKISIAIADSMTAPLYQDSEMGIGWCGAVVAFMKADTYYVQVRQTNMNAIVNDYRLEIKVHSSVGVEQEPNDDKLPQVANMLSGSDVYLGGSHQEATDPDIYPDYYQIQVDNPASLRAEIIEGDLTKNCQPDGINSILDLYDGGGNFVVSDNNSGRGNCSLIDGTGTNPATPLAKNLMPGTYFLKVHSSYPNDAGMFEYRIAVTLR